jgi:GNAT superfamily N-acetyltransferase
MALDNSEEARVKRAFKEAVTFLLGPYRFNRVYRWRVNDAELQVPHGMSVERLEGSSFESTPSTELRDRFSYGGHDAYGYGLSFEGCLAAVCWFWGPRRFDDPLLWSLEDGEAIMVDLVTASAFRGQGLASVLIRYASADMRRAGWKSLYTWMWHTHRASYHAFERAGWHQIAWVLEIHPFGIPQALRFQWQAFRRPSPVGDRREKPSLN